VKFIYYISIILSVLLSVVSGCTFEEDLAGSQDPLFQVTALKAASIDSTSVLLTWIPSANDSSPLFEKYRLYWTYVNAADSSIGTTDSVDLPRGTSRYLVAGLAKGVEYLFTLYINPQSLAVRPYTSIRWAPASNYGITTLSSQAVLALYDSTQNPAGPSVIALDDPDAQSYGDLFLHDDMTLRSASLKGTGWRRTLFSTIQISADSVPLPMVLFPAISSFTDSIVSVQPKTIFFCKTQDGHYARLYVKDIPPMARPISAITLNVSYQTRQSLLYAKWSGD
jgi:hypothetical protein